MPCYDPETHERPVRLEGKVNKLTAMLCGLCARLDTNPTSQAKIFEDPLLAQWWKQHKEHDALIVRIKDKQRLYGDAALTPTERGTLMYAADVSYDDGEVGVRIIG